MGASLTMFVVQELENASFVHFPILQHEEVAVYMFEEISQHTII